MSTHFSGPLIINGVTIDPVATNALVVANDTGSNIAAGKLVYINGHNGTNPTIALADKDAMTTSATHCVVEAIDTGDTGSVFLSNLLTEVNTNAYTAGDPVYLGDSGAYAAAAPTGAADTVQVVGFIAVKSATVGKVFLCPSFSEAQKVLVTADVSDLTATVAEINAVCDANTATAAEISELHGREAVFSKTVTATMAEINTGKALIAAVAGVTVKILNFTLVVAGGFEASAGTGILLQDSNVTPVVVATIAKAALTDGAIVMPTTENVALGAGFAASLTAAKGLNIIKNGDALDAGTSIAVTVTYSLV